MVLLFLWLCSWKVAERQPGSTVTFTLGGVILALGSSSRKKVESLNSLSPHKRMPVKPWWRYENCPLTYATPGLPASVL